VQHTPKRLLSRHAVMASLSLSARLALGAGLTVAVLPGAPAMAQSPGYFVPNQPAAPAARPRPERAAPRQSPITQQPLPPPPTVEIPGGLATGGPASPDADQPVAQLPQQPVPDLPALPRGSTPPAAVIGVLGVPEIMHGVVAAQQVEKAIGERREKLNEDAQKEQAAWRDLQAQLSAQRATLSPDQIRTKERELQERITNAQKSFRDRNRIIQEAAQYALGQIERNLIGVIRQVSESHGMNLVLHRQQVALNINEFDITDQVIEQMNKVMPSVKIPPDGVSPVAQAQADAAAAKAAGAPGAQAPTPTSAPAAPPATRR
jgi:Skp family chaperone for outer membrane proteins